MNDWHKRGLYANSVHTMQKMDRLNGNTLEIELVSASKTSITNAVALSFGYDFRKKHFKKDIAQAYKENVSIFKNYSTKEKLEIAKNAKQIEYID